MPVVSQLTEFESSPLEVTSTANPVPVCGSEFESSGRQTLRS